MNPCPKRSICHISVKGSFILKIFAIAFVVMTFVICTSPAGGAVLVTGKELSQVKKNITKEPLRGLFQRLSGGDGGNAAPILYLLTGEEKFARTARSTVQSSLANLRRYLPYKTNIWILYGPGWLESAVLAYDMTKESGLYTDEEVREMKETLSRVIKHYLNEGTDHLGKWFLYQTDYIPEDTEDWVTANMNVHRFQAVGLYALAFPEEPRSKELIKYTVDYFERVLSLGSRPGGAWSENPRYMRGVLSRLFLLAAGLKNAGVHDFFQDERFKAMLGFFAESIPVPGMEGPNGPTILAAGDTDWYENGGTILGLAASRYYDNEPEMAGEWIWCWKNLGSPLAAESLLFLNPDIEPVKPEYKSFLPGMGYAVLRDRFAEPDETFFFATFGPELGTSNRAMHHHPNHGDFSLIWRGYPITLARGCSSYMWSRRMRDQVDFSHNVVTFDGAGETIAIPEKKYGGPAIEVNKGFDESLVRDYYPDGVTNFISTPGFDYTAGQVRNWDIGLPAPFNVRHFIHLKPDVFVIWDQVRSPYPLQWNFHLPAESVTSSGKRIDITTHDGVTLSVDFLQDEPLDFTLDWPLESIRAQWPMVLSCPYGKGMFIFNALDITRQVLDNNHEGARRILENLLSYHSPPNRIGLIETDGQTEEVLKRLGFTYELLDYDDLESDLSRFDRIVLGHFAMLVRDRDLMDYSEKLWKYVEDGGVCYWSYQFAWGWKPGDTSGPGYFPRALMVGEGTSVLWGEGIELDCPVSVDEDSIWKSPNRITMNDWEGWQVGPPDTTKLLHHHLKPNTDRARNIPVYYSDHWRVHASALKTYNIQIPITRSRLGPYRWIKVHHRPSDDFLAVLRPWKEDVSPAVTQKGAEEDLLKKLVLDKMKDNSAIDNASAQILKGAENEALISQGEDFWWVLPGKHDGITGNLTVLRYKADQMRLSTASDGTQKIDECLRVDVTPRELLLVDARDASIGGLDFTFEHPSTFFFNLDESSGKLSTLEGGKIILPWKLKKVTVNGSKIKLKSTHYGAEITLSGGEYTLELSGDNLEITRKSHVGQVKVVDASGNPVKWVHIFRDLPEKGRTSFQGATDRHGLLTLRWDGEENHFFKNNGSINQMITLEKGKKSIREMIKPGTQKIVFK